MKLQTKIFLFLIPLILAPIFLVGWIAYDRLQSMSQKTLRNQMTASMVSAGRELKYTITSTEANIGLYVQAEQLVNFVLTNDEEHRYGIMLPPLLRLFSSFQKAFENYIEIRVLAPDGYEDARLSQVKNISEYEAGNRISSGG